MYTKALTVFKKFCVQFIVFLLINVNMRSKIVYNCLIIQNKKWLYYLSYLFFRTNSFSLIKRNIYDNGGLYYEET